MQTASVPGLTKHLSTINSPKKWLLPEPRPKFSGLVESGELDRTVAARLLAVACRANGYLKKRGPDVVREVIARVLKWQRE